MQPTTIRQKIEAIRADAPSTRRAILDQILEDPERVLAENVEQLAERTGSSVPTIMRTLQPGGACCFQMHQDDVDRVITHALTMIGSGGTPR